MRGDFHYHIKGASKGSCSGLGAEDIAWWAKHSIPDIRALTVRERILLFCVGSGTIGNGPASPARSSLTWWWVALSRVMPLGARPSRIAVALRYGRCCRSCEASAVQRCSLELLASSRNGVNEELFVLGHGISCRPRPTPGSQQHSVR
jgi:hypothetical protein